MGLSSLPTGAIQGIMEVDLERSKEVFNEYDSLIGVVKRTLLNISSVNYVGPPNIMLKQE